MDWCDLIMVLNSWTCDTNPPSIVCGPVCTLAQEGGVVYVYGGERGLAVLHRLAQACHALAQGKVRPY